MTALGSKITGNTEQMTLQTLAASSFKKYTMKHILVHSAEVIKNLFPLIWEAGTIMPLNSLEITLFVRENMKYLLS